MKSCLYFNKISICLNLFLSISFAWSQESPNIIFLIGDGMGLTQISAGMYANGNNTALEDFEFIGLSKTNAANKFVTDSAASGTAMATGIKTVNGAIGMDTNNFHHESILEICQEKGYKTALIATSSIVHATPASFYAKVTYRYKHEKIALQLSQHSIDIFVGGGSKHFTDREDGRNLIKEMDSYNFVRSLSQFKKSKASKIAFFTYKDEPPSIINKRSPKLNELTKIALDKLSSHKNPFFIMIEASQIDWGGHANNLDRVTSEFIEFNATIKEALEFAKNDGNTLVIVTADHETGGLALIGGNITENTVVGSFNTKGHTATMVPVFSYGPNADSFKGIYENTEIFEKMKKTLN